MGNIVLLDELTINKIYLFFTFQTQNKTPI